jgi:ribosome-binding protein aMBF1 (putative translation factor)
MPPKALKRCDVCGKFSAAYLVDDAKLGRLNVCLNCWKRGYAIATPPAEKRDPAKARPRRRRPASRLR